MRSLRFGQCFFLVLSLSFVSAQASPQSDVQARAIIQASLSAMGGSAALQVNDTVTQVAITFPGDSERRGSMTIKTKGADRMRLEGATGGPALVFDRGRAARSRDGQWETRPSGNARNKRTDHIPALLIANEFRRQDVTLSYLGNTQVEGRDTYHLRAARVSSLGVEEDAKLTKDSEIDVFIDTQSFVVVKVSFTYLSATDWRRGLPMEILYGDYRAVGGLLIPYSQRVFFNGNPMSERRIVSFAANVGLSDSEFEGR